MTAFSTRVVGQALDVGRLADPTPYAHPVNYAPCHDLAEDVRRQEGAIIRFPSVRDKGGVNVAVLNCSAFQGGIGPTQGWWFRFAERGLFAAERFGEGRLEFPFEMFADDPRITLVALG